MIDKNAAPGRVYKDRGSAQTAAGRLFMMARARRFAAIALRFQSTDGVKVRNFWYRILTNIKLTDNN